MFVVSGCTDAAEDKKSTAKSEICDISFENIGPCVYGDIKVNQILKKSQQMKKRCNGLMQKSMEKSFQ